MSRRRRTVAASVACACSLVSPPRMERDLVRTARSRNSRGYRFAADILRSSPSLPASRVNNLSTRLF